MKKTASSPRRQGWRWPEWWQFSRCENSARATAGGKNARDGSHDGKVLRRGTRRYGSQREPFYHSGLDAAST
jgi:hypothetical protein